MRLVDAVRHRRTEHTPEMRATALSTAAPESGDPVDSRAGQAVEPTKKKHHYVRNTVAGVLLAATAAGGVAAIPASVWGPAGGAVQSVVSTVVPSSVQSAINGVIGTNSNQDPSNQYGALYMVNTDGTHQVLDTSGQTTPTGQNVPANAVVNNRVILMEEGIGDQIPSYANDTHAMLMTQGAGTFDVHQPVLGVHEGTMTTTADEVLRSTTDITYTKVLENGGSVSQAQVYQNDPAVKTIHDVVKQQLDAGHDVLLIPHSGGSPEASLALNMLSHENPQYKTLIGEHVRVLDLAGASAPQDFQDAGVHANSIYFTASKVDPIGTFGATYISPSNPGAIATAVGDLTQNLGQPTHHTNKEIFALNTAPNGHNAIENFVEGGPGGTHIQ